MKYLVIVLALVLSACASTATKEPAVSNGYVRVLGTGKTSEEARLNGFQLAVEIAVGAIVVAEKQATNNLLVRDQILKHSSGYVDDFKVIDSSRTNLGHTVTMDVKVKSSQIANVILSTGDNKNQLDSSRIYAQYNSYTKEREDAEKLINNLLDGFPRRAFDSKIKYTKITTDNNRDMVFSISVDINWNNAWVNSLSENLARVKDETKTTDRKISIVRLSPSMFSLSDDITDLYINDEKIFKNVSEKIFTTLYPVIEVVDSNGRFIIRGCGFNYPNFNKIRITNTHTVNANYTIPKNSDTFNNMKNMDRVNVFMTSNPDVCAGKL
jgi:hypothetical protein